MKELTQAEALELFWYNNGKLYWKPKQDSLMQHYKEAGCVNVHGYNVIGTNKKHYYTHRVIFLMHYGYLPKYIDHINGVRTDNRLENLREATVSQNNHNSKTPKTNTTGYKNVY